MSRELSGGVDLLLLSTASGGGVRRTQQLLANGLARAGRRVAVAVPEPGAPFLDRLDAAVEVHRLGGNGAPLRLLLALRRAIRQLRPNVIVASQDQSILPLAMLRAIGPLMGLGTEAPFIGCVHNNPVNLQNARHPLARAIPAFAGWAYRRTDAVVAVSEGLGECLARRYSIAQDRVHVIYNPVLEPECSTGASPGDLARGSDAPIPSRYVLGVGNFNAQKDFGTLLRAFARIADGYTGDLVILGDGPLRGEIEDEAAGLGIAERLKLPGFADSRRYFARADAFVLSSRWEGFGLVLVEAMAVGCPVVSTDCDFGPREILVDGALGPLAPVGDDAALAEGIANVLSEPPERGRLQARAASFSTEAAVGAYMALANSLRPHGI